MTERPILFSGPMVRALLAGTKTQTRRVASLDVINDDPERYDFLGMVSGPDVPHYAFRDKKTGAQTLVRFRSGQPGDKLWVREAWRAPSEFDRVKPSDLKPSSAALLGTPIIYEATRHESVQFGKLRPSMFMPRWACRLTLEVTGVRVERLQDISEADAKAEGVTMPPQRAPYRDACGELVLPLQRTARDAYGDLWEQINGPGSWDANPWVGVVEFRRLT